MGIFDQFLQNTTPEQARGLLAAGLALMKSRGPLLSQLGTAGQIGIEEMGRFRQQQQADQLRELQRQMLGYQVQGQQREQQIAALPQRFYQPGGAEAVDATGGMDTATTNPNNVARPEGFDVQGYLKALQGMDFGKYLQTAAALQKDNKPIISKPGEIARDPNTGGIIWQNPGEGDKPTATFKDYQQAVSGGYKGSFMQYQTELKRAGATNVNVPVNTEKTYSGNLAEGLAKNDMALLEAAQSAPDRIRSAQDVKRILSTQKPITGTGASLRLELTKALSTAGVIDGKTVTSTEDLVNLLANQTLDAIKSSGLGSGQGFTDKDRQFLQDAKSGRIEINQQTLYRMADLNERSARAAITKGNAVAQRLKADKNLGSVAGAVNEVPMPNEIVLPTADAIEAEIRRRAEMRR